MSLRITFFFFVRLKRKKIKTRVVKNRRLKRVKKRAARRWKKRSPTLNYWRILLVFFQRRCVLFTKCSKLPLLIPNCDRKLPALKLLVTSEVLIWKLAKLIRSLVYFFSLSKHFGIRFAVAKFCSNYSCQVNPKTSIWSDSKQYVSSDGNILLLWDNNSFLAILFFAA